jgi:hypothetical protein
MYVTTVARSQALAKAATYRQLASAATKAVTHATATGTVANAGAGATAETMRKVGRFRMMSTYKYPFPTIPRPKRNIFYYNPVTTITRGLRGIPVRKVSSLNRYFRVNDATRRLVPRTVKRGYGTFRKGLNVVSFRGYSTNQGAGSTGTAPGGFRRVGWQWLAVPAATIIIWSVLKNRRQRKEGEGKLTGTVPATMRNEC